MENSQEKLQSLIKKIKVVYISPYFISNNDKFKKDSFYEVISSEIDELLEKTMLYFFKTYIKDIAKKKEFNRNTLDIMSKKISEDIFIGETKEISDLREVILRDLINHQEDEKEYLLKKITESVRKMVKTEISRNYGEHENFNLIQLELESLNRLFFSQTNRKILFRDSDFFMVTGNHDDDYIHWSFFFKG